MKRTRKRKGGGWFDWIWKKSKTTLTKEDEKELIRMTKERARPSVDVRTGEYRAVALRKRKPLDGGRRQSRRKRRRSRRGGQWCKCSDLEKYLIKRNKRKIREERSETSARRYDERKRKKEMEAMKAAMSPDALSITSSDGTMTYVRPPPRTPPRTSRKLRREDSNSALVAGGRRRRTRHRRKRRRTRRKRRRRRTRRKRGGAPRWLKGVNTDYTWKDKSDWYVLPKKKTKIKGKRKSAAYPHFHGGMTWINFTFGGDDHIRLWLENAEEVNAATLNRFLERLKGVTDRPAEWDKIVEFLRTMVRTASPRKPKSPSALPPVRVSGPPPARNPNQSWAANKGRQARAITPPSPFIVEQMREQRKIQERKEAERVAREAENRESLQRDEASRQRKREIAAKEKKEIAQRAHEAAEIFGAGGWSDRLTDYRAPKEGRSRSRFFATLGENRQTEEEKLLFDESAAAYEKVRAKFAKEIKT